MTVQESINQASRDLIANRVRSFWIRCPEILSWAQKSSDETLHLMVQSLTDEIVSVLDYTLGHVPPLPGTLCEAFYPNGPQEDEE